MNPKIILCLALVLSGGLSACGMSIEWPVTPKSLDQGQFVFSISTNSLKEGVSFHVTITAKTGIIPSDSVLYLCLVTTTAGGGGSIVPVTAGPKVTLQKDGHIWKADFVASSDMVKNPDFYLDFDVIAHDAKGVPMPSADFYEIKLHDFLKP